MIERLAIEHFKSIERLDLELGPLTVLVGPNGAGKSNVIDAFRFLRDAIRFGLDRAVSDRHGIDSIRQWSHKGAFVVSLTAHASAGEDAGRYSFALGSSRKEYVIRREEAQWVEQREDETWHEDIEGNLFPETYRYAAPGSFARALDGSYKLVVEGREESGTVAQKDELALPLGRFSHFRRLAAVLSGFEAYSIFPNTLKTPQLPSNDQRLSATGDNLTSIFKQMTKSPRGTEAKAEIVQALQKIMPGLDTVVVQSIGGYLAPMFRVQEEAGRHDFNVSQISDGTLRIFGLLTALYQPRAPAVIALEEPEQTVHPGVLALLADAIREASTRSQVIVTTHSPELVDHFKPEEIRAVEMVDGVTSVRPISASQKEAVKRNLFSLGELMRIEGLHGT